MGPLGRSGRAVAPVFVALALLASALPFASARPTSAAESVAMPFQGGQSVSIIQGYNGGTHQGRSQYGLDLVLADGGTSGAEVVSPIEGTVTYAQAPKVGNGCMAVTFTDGSYSVMLCHVIFHRTHKRGETVTRGQSLGTVGPAGTVGNNGAPHVHMELHRGSSVSSPVAFSASGGLTLEGLDLASSGKRNEHGSRDTIASSNRAGGGIVASTTTRSGETTQRLSAQSDTPTLVAASIAPGTVLQSATSTPDSANRTATVQGTESCLKVRKQPSATAAVVTCLKEGSEVSVKPLASGADVNWRQVDGGWASSEYLKRSRAVVSGADTCLNVRESAAKAAKLVGCLPEGTAVTISEGPKTADGFAWYKIEKAGALDKGGWVVGKYLD